MKIFEEKTQPSLGWAGTEMQKRKLKDKFGEIKVGEYRHCLINTEWGQLKVPYKLMGKKIRIKVEVV